MVEAAQAQRAFPAPRIDPYLEAVSRQVERRPDFPALQRIRPVPSGFEVQALTYGELAHRAAAYADFFRRHGIGRGDRVMMSLSSPHDLVSALLGLMSMGAAAVPLQTVGEFRTPVLFRERVTRVASDCRPRLVLVEDLQRFEGVMGSAGDLPPTVQAVIPAGTSYRLAFERLPPETPAFIQYTSGSTGTPRGVVVTHENIAANVEAVGIGTRTSEADRFVSWLPLHHDMGLVSLLWCLHAGISNHVMSPLAFLLRPVNWLRAIHHVKATQSVAPTFAYSLCWRKIPDSQLEGLDLSSWRVAYCGAEPVDPAVVRGFSSRFAPYGLRPTAFFPVYGLAEATLAAAFPRPETLPVFDVVDRDELGLGFARPVAADSPRAVTFTSVGSGVYRHHVEIVDPATGQPCPERRVGEIVVHGPSVSPRYHHEDSLSRRSQLSTGDLGYIAGGELFVIDRLKDLVIIRGQNFAPSDLELRAATVRGLRRGRVVAFSLPGPEGTERLHLVGELDPRSWRRQSAIAAELRRRFLEVFGLELAGVALVAPGAIPRTSSGKLRRRACRDLYAARTYRPRAALRTRIALQLRLARQRLFLAVLGEAAVGGDGG